MNKNSIITIVVIAGGGYLLYWYLQNYGPNGAVSVAGGAGSYWASWFGGATTTTPAVTSSTTSTTTTTGTGTTATASAPLATATQISQIQSLLQSSDQAAFTAMIPTLTQAQAAAMLNNAALCVGQGQMAGSYYSLSANSCVGTATTVSPNQTQANLLLQASGNATSLTVSQWNYYMTNGGNGVPPIDPNGQFPALNDGGVPMSVDAYLALRAANGLSGIGNIMPISPGITQATTGVSGLGQIMPLSPFITPADNGVRAGGAVGMSNGGGAGGPGAPYGGMGAITRVSSPWGRMPSRRVH